MKEVGNNFQESVLSLLVGSDDSTQVSGLQWQMLLSGERSPHLSGPNKKTKETNNRKKPTL